MKARYASPVRASRLNSPSKALLQFQVNLLQNPNGTSSLFNQQCNYGATTSTPIRLHIPPPTHHPQNTVRPPWYPNISYRSLSYTPYSAPLAYSCRVCPVRASSPFALQEHMRTDHPSSMCCRFCPAVFGFEWELHQHYLYQCVNVISVYKCPTCGDNLMKEHVAKCPGLTKYLKEKKPATKNTATVHIKEEQSSCSAYSATTPKSASVKNPWFPRYCNQPVASTLVAREDDSLERTELVASNKSPMSPGRKIFKMLKAKYGGSPNEKKQNNAAGKTLNKKHGCPKGKRNITTGVSCKRKRGRPKGKQNKVKDLLRDVHHFSSSETPSNIIQQARQEKTFIFPGGETPVGTIRKALYQKDAACSDNDDDIESAHSNTLDQKTFVFPGGSDFGESTDAGKHPNGDHCSTNYDEFKDEPCGVIENESNVDDVGIVFGDGHLFGGGDQSNRSCGCYNGGSRFFTSWSPVSTGADDNNNTDIDSATYTPLQVMKRNNGRTYSACN